jgi:hypothetical protein
MTHHDKCSLLIQEKFLCLNYSRQCIGAEKIIITIMQPNLAGEANNFVRY